jgi:hypothetical protein
MKHLMIHEMIAYLMKRCDIPWKGGIHGSRVTSLVFALASLNRLLRAPYTLTSTLMLYKLVYRSLKTPL